MSTADLTRYAHPHVDGEWRLGADRGLWTAGHPVVATAHPDDDGHTVSFGRGGFRRDELPELIGFRAGVYSASRPAQVDDAEAAR